MVSVGGLDVALVDSTVALDELLRTSGGFPLLVALTLSPRCPGHYYDPSVLEFESYVEPAATRL